MLQCIPVCLNAVGGKYFGSVGAVASRRRRGGDTLWFLHRSGAQIDDVSILAFPGFGVVGKEEPQHNQQVPRAIQRSKVERGADVGDDHLANRRLAPFQIEEGARQPRAMLGRRDWARHHLVRHKPRENSTLLQFYIAPILHCSMVSIIFNPKPAPKPLQCFNHCYMPAVALGIVSFTYSIGNAPIVRMTRRSDRRRDPLSRAALATLQNRGLEYAS